MNIPLNIDWQQILLHFFNFSILVGGLYLLLFKPVKDFMAKREQHYQAIDDDAAAKLREAEEKVKSADERVAALDNELTAQRESAAKEASALAERQRATAKAEAIRSSKPRAPRASVSARRSLTTLTARPWPLPRPLWTSS